MLRWRKMIDDAMHAKKHGYHTKFLANEDTIASKKSKIVKFVTIGAGIAAGIGAVAVAGPFGLAMFVPEAGLGLLSGITVASASGAGTVGAAITKGINSLIPKSNFLNKKKQTPAIQSQPSENNSQNTGKRCHIM